MRNFAVLMLSLFFLMGVARAQGTSEARRHFELGTKYYDLQRYAEAAKEYEAAFVIKDDPALLFNIAQAYRLAGEHAKAIGAYRSYLRREPHTSQRAEVEARINELQRLIDQQKQSTQHTSVVNAP